MPRSCSDPIRLALFLVASLVPSLRLSAQEPANWGPALEFATFSIAAVDPRTGETGVGKSVV